VAEESPTLAKELQALEPFIGKTWKGAFKHAEKPTFDISKWERALNGKAVRILHSVNEGEYGGETIMMWNSESKQIEFTYFTTAGFFTKGTVTVEKEKLITREQVTGNANGISEVKAVTEFTPEGKLRVRADYMKEAKSVGGHEIDYEKSPESKVIFK